VAPSTASGGDDGQFFELSLEPAQRLRLTFPTKGMHDAERKIVHDLLDAACSPLVQREAHAIKRNRFRILHV
jgi:hypothetical protein